MLLCLQVNILIVNAHQARIGDFGSARLEDDPNESAIGTPRWMAPVLHDPYADDPLTSRASDVWAFALTVLEVTSFIYLYNKFSYYLR
jgi:serine/threonine protein kinase